MFVYRLLCVVIIGSFFSVSAFGFTENSGVKPDLDSDDPPVSTKNQFLAKVGYAPPLIDLDNSDGGSLGLRLGAERLLAGRVPLGLRLGYMQLLIQSEANLAAWIIELQAVTGCYLVAGLNLRLAVGVSIVGTSSFGDVRHDPYFTMAVGIGYTFWLKEGEHGDLGLDVGTDINLMIDDRFKKTGSLSGVETENVFAYLVIYLGFRYSFGQNQKVNGE